MTQANINSRPADLDEARPGTVVAFSRWRVLLALVIVASIFATILWVGWLGWLLMRAASALF
jgi:hypothetical protein